MGGVIDISEILEAEEHKGIPLDQFYNLWGCKSEEADGVALHLDPV